MRRRRPELVTTASGLTSNALPSDIELLRLRAFDDALLARLAIEHLTFGAGNGRLGQWLDHWLRTGCLATLWRTAPKHLRLRRGDRHRHPADRCNQSQRGEASSRNAHGRPQRIDDHQHVALFVERYNLVLLARAQTIVSPTGLHRAETLLPVTSMSANRPGTGRTVSPTSLCRHVTGFGCRPSTDGSTSTEGRRSEAVTKGEVVPGEARHACY
jgi:hypothetical protein